MLTNPADIAAQEQLRQQERERIQRQQQEKQPDVRLPGAPRVRLSFLLLSLCLNF